MRNNFSSKSIHMLSAPITGLYAPDGAPSKPNPFPRLRVDNQIYKIHMWKVSAHLFFNITRRTRAVDHMGDRGM